MNLHEFIKEALIEITGGVAEAREIALKRNVSIGSDSVYGATTGIITDDNGRVVSQKGGIGVFLGSVGLGSQGAAHGETATHSRIKFTVPVVLPGRGRSKDSD